MNEFKNIPGPYEIRFHHAIPDWCKIIGLNIRDIPECEGGGHAIPEKDAWLISGAPKLLETAEEMLEHCPTCDGEGTFEIYRGSSHADSIPCDVCGNLREAISKAKGKQNE